MYSPAASNTPPHGKNGNDQIPFASHPRPKSQALLVAATSISTLLIQGKVTLGKAAVSSGLSARPDPSAVEIEAVDAGLDPADVLTVVTQAECSSGAAIFALRQADGDVVNAVMNLTDIGGVGASGAA